MDFNTKNSSSGMVSVQHGANKLAEVLGLGTTRVQVPFSLKQPVQAPMPRENNPIKRAFRDSLLTMSPEAAKELLQQRRESLGGLLGGILANGGVPAK